MITGHRAPGDAQLLPLMMARDQPAGYAVGSEASLRSTLPQFIVLDLSDLT